MLIVSLFPLFIPKHIRVHTLFRSFPPLPSGGTLLLLPVGTSGAPLSEDLPRLRDVVPTHTTQVPCPPPVVVSPSRRLLGNPVGPSDRSCRIKKTEIYTYSHSVRISRHH